MKSSRQTCQLGDEGGEWAGGRMRETYSNLNFFSVELGLDGSESSQLSKLENTDKPN